MAFVLIRDVTDVGFSKLWLQVPFQGMTQCCCSDLILNAHALYGDGVAAAALAGGECTSVGSKTCPRRFGGMDMPTLTTISSPSLTLSEVWMMSLSCKAKHRQRGWGAKCI